VTPAILAGYRPYLRPNDTFSMLACHDPGNIYNTTEVLRLVMYGEVPTWVVVGEFQTEQTTAVDHAREFRNYIAGKLNRDPMKVATFVDPHGRGQSQTDYQTVYGAFQSQGINVFSPAPMTGTIKRSARVEMVNRLLQGSAVNTGTPRLVVATDDSGAPLAPKLVDAFESLVKRPGDDDPEGIQRKDKADKTHAPAAIGYGLWAFEQQALTEATIKTALAEARRLRV
jgi:hypothetical protein